MDNGKRTMLQDTPDNKLKTKIQTTTEQNKPSEDLINLIDSFWRTWKKRDENLHSIWNDIKNQQKQDGLSDEQTYQLMKDSAKRLGYAYDSVRKIVEVQYKDSKMSALGKKGSDVTNKKRKLELVSRPTPEMSRREKGILEAIKNTEILVENRKLTDIVKYKELKINELEMKLEKKPEQQAAAGELKIKFFLPDLEKSLKAFVASQKRKGFIIVKDGEFDRLL